MAIRKLNLDDFFQDEEFSLIGIHCTIEDYRLAFLLNKTLSLNLSRKTKDLDNVGLGSNHPIFEWENHVQFTTWHFVTNSCKVENSRLQPVANSLFNELTTTTQTHYLVPEFKQANYLLKVESEVCLTQEKHTLNKILQIPQIVTAYTIASNQLKSKKNLIFN